MDPTNVVGRRVGAFVIDGLLISVICGIAWYALTTKVPGECVGGGVTINGDCRGFESGSSNRTVWFLIILIVGLTIRWILPGLRGTSPGKAMLGLRIVGPDGGVPGLGRAFVRGLMLIVDAFPYIIPYLTGFICALTDDRHRRVGDRVANTLVVDKNAAGQPIAAGGAPFAGAGAGPGGGAPGAGPSPGGGAVAAGWYSDPQGQARLRWWDGSTWTSHTSD
jgi:uncharacterized RDD family membrane protein YckC